jgi:hypothetical protein
VVASCREQEYESYLEPVEERAPALAGRFEALPLPPLHPDEVRTFAEAFFHQRPELAARLDVDSFVSGLLDLRRRLSPVREISSSPLLLGLLCDLYAPIGEVPTDLTVHRLYERYWQERVRGTRGGRDRARARDAMCIRAARQMLERSTTRLRFHLDQDELLHVDDPVLPASGQALDDLLSEGVLADKGGSGLTFFHQTFAEYAMARWLTRDAATGPVTSSLVACEPVMPVPPISGPSPARCCSPPIPETRRPSGRWPTGATSKSLSPSAPSPRPPALVRSPGPFSDCCPSPLPGASSIRTSCVRR